MAGSVPTSGLVAAWNLTGQTAGVQSIAGAHGTPYALQMGETSGVDAFDPTAVLPTGLQLTTAAGDDFCKALTLPDTNLLGDITIVFVGKIEFNIQMSIVSKFASAGALNTNVPLYFWTNSTGKLELRRCNASTFHAWSGQFADHANFQMYAVTSAVPIQTQPTFWVNKNKVAQILEGGAATGNPTGNAGLLRVGTNDGVLPAAGTYSYLLLYSRILTDGELGGIFDYMETLMGTLGETLKGFGSHLMDAVTLGGVQTVTASGGNGFELFDNSNDNWQSTTTATSWVQLFLGTFQVARTLESYSLLMNHPDKSMAPKNWTISGSNDGIAWTVLDTVTNEAAWTNTARTYAVDTLAGPFKYFRYTVTLNQGSGVEHALTEWRLYEVIAAEAPTAADHWLPMLGVGA